MTDSCTVIAMLMTLDSPALHLQFARFGLLMPYLKLGRPTKREPYLINYCLTAII